MNRKPDLQAAVERLRRLERGEMLMTVYPESEFATSRCARQRPQDRFDDDAHALANAFIKSYPPEPGKVGAVIRRHDGNISSVSLVSLSERCAVFHVSTNRKRDILCCLSGHAVFLNPVDPAVTDVMGEAIEFIGLPPRWLLYAEDCRYGVLVTIVDGEGWRDLPTTEASRLPQDVV